MKLLEYWNAFLRWKGWAACARGWAAFVHWSGWRAFARWPGWKKLLFPHPLLVLLLTALSAVGLVWVFLRGMDQHPVAYFVYCLSFYALVTLTVLIPGLVQRVKAFIHATPKLEQALKDHELHFKIELYGEQLLNFGYGIFKCIGAYVYRDAWMGTDGFYNLTQGIIQLVQILRRRKNLTMEQQWKSYRLCGWLIFLMHLSTTGISFLMIHDHMSEEYPGYMIFATAAFAFYKLISSFIDVAKDRKHTAPIDSSVRLLDLSQALFNLFSLQVALLHVFGNDFSLAGMMNTLTGSAVSLLMVGMGIYMLRRSKRELKNISLGDSHGTESFL